MTSMDGNRTWDMMLQYSDELDEDEFESFVKELRTEIPNTSELARKFVTEGCNMFDIAKLKDVELLKQMVDFGVGIDSMTDMGSTALIRAAEMGDLEMARWLIDNGATIDIVDMHGDTPLLFSADNLDKDMMECLLVSGADPNLKDVSDDTTALYYVFSNEKEEAVNIIECAKILIQYGAIPENSIKEDMTLFDLVLDLDINHCLDILLGAVATLEVLEKVVAASVMHCNSTEHKSKQPELQRKYELHKKIFKMKIYRGLTILELLQVEERKMIKLVRNKQFMSEIRKFCSDYNMAETYIYMCNRIMKKIVKASEVVNLEDEAISIICKLMSSSYNQCYTFSKKVIDYLYVSDLKSLVEIK